MSRSDPILVACAVVNTAVGVCLAWPQVRPALLTARARVERQFDRLPGPPLVPCQREPSAAELSEVRLSYVPDGWA